MIPEYSENNAVTFSTRQPIQALRSRRSRQKWADHAAGKFELSIDLASLNLAESLMKGASAEVGARLQDGLGVSKLASDTGRRTIGASRACRGRYYSGRSRTRGSTIGSFNSEKS